MTGGDFSLEAMLAVISAVLGAVGSAFGWPVLVQIADWIKKRDAAAKLKAVPQPVESTADMKPLADTKEFPTPPKEIL